MIKSICGKLIYLIIAIMLLQSCKKEIEKFPIDDETSLVKNWYEKSGKPFALEWSKLEKMRGRDESMTLVVPLENGLNIGPEYGSLQNILFTIDAQGLVKGIKVDLFSDTRTITEHSKEMISNYVENRGHNNQELGKVYFIVNDFKDNLLNSQLMDKYGLKSIDVQLTSQEIDFKAKEKNDSVKKKSSTSPSIANIPVVCKDWYLVEYFDDGSAEWNYLYTTCSGGGSGGSSGGGGSGGGSGSSGTSTDFIALAPVDSIDIEDRLNCFNSVQSNATTQYKITLHVHSAHKGYPTQEYWAGDPGHAYVTLEKSNGSNVQRLSFGFYPKVDTWVTPTKNAVASGMGEESSNPDRRSDIRITGQISASAFNNAVNNAKTGSNKPYDLNDFNCTDYAIDVFNASQSSSSKLNVPNSNIGFTTPAGLYKSLDQLRIGGNTNVVNISTGPLISTNCN